MDNQVKIRGYRIELGEIENAMEEIGYINGCCVVVKKDLITVNRLVSYYLPKREIIKAKEQELYSRLITNWKELYETEYEKTEGGEVSLDEEFNIIGWNDSFTGKAIPEEQMREWLQDIVEVIMTGKPQNVLEIGSGTGLIYYQLAGKIKKYIGTDFSRSAINQITKRINKGVRDYGPTELRVCAAHEVSLKDDEQVDTVILNSIVQYFPGEDYMTDVIGKSISFLKGRGRIIIGDVRDNRLLELFKARLHLNKMQQSKNVKEFKWTVDQDVLKEEELCFSPDYFYRLQSQYPEITHIVIKWKQGSYINELTLYRYTVVIYIGAEAEVIKPEWQNWNDFTDMQSIISQLEEGADIMALKDVPNPRLVQERLLSNALQHRTVNTVGDIIDFLGREEKGGMDLDQIVKVAQAKGYGYRLLLDEDPLKMNVLIEQKPSGSFIQQPYSEKGFVNNTLSTNIPLFNDISSELQKDIRALLHKRLPQYMVPSEMIALLQLPLTRNGKVDRVFLSEREDKGLVNTLNYQPPVTELEHKIVRIWQELLALERVGIHDNFFELGGHSLLAIRVISAIKKELNVELAVNDIFIHPTIGGLVNKLKGKNKELSEPAIRAKYLVPLKARGNKTALYIVCGGGGTATLYKQFAEMLDADLPVYALQSPIDTEITNDFPDEIEKIANVYIEEVLIQNPNGPYALSGHCMGGLIAFEMSRQLEAMGKNVQFLAVFDSFIPEKLIREPLKARDLFRRSTLINKFPRIALQLYLLKHHKKVTVQYKIKNLKKFIVRVKRKLFAEKEPVGLEVFHQSENLFKRAYGKYNMKPYDKDIVAFFVKAHYSYTDRENNVIFGLTSYDDSTDNRWKNYARSVTKYMVEGEHITLFHPKHCKKFVNILQHHLNKSSGNY
jgi:thioesterase domain-containing protein/ubiquinone/menaquinone biosynthesis C-methylase UbiE/acyl carrier protein